MKKLYRARELADILGVNPQTIYRAGERGDIVSYRIGRAVRFEMPTERDRQCLVQETKC